MHLKWGDIDLAARTTSFQPAYTKTKELRVVPMTEALHGELQAWHDALEEKPKPGDWLFRDEKTGRRIGSFRRAFGVMCKAVGIDCRYHALRHTFASRLAAKKVHVRLIAELIGDRVETSMRYVHHDSSLKAGAVEEIGIGGEEAPAQAQGRLTREKEKKAKGKGVAGDNARRG
jgi:integrase